MRRTSKVIAATADMPRRQALIWAGGALLALAGTALFARKAAAITLVEADEKTQALYHSVCGPVAYHEKLVADARAALEGSRPGPRAELASLDCPVCGCRLRLDEAKVDAPR
ncbi:hypothetical protein [Reyranella sp. CPCC 100927]|uniref:hypothetical protein n=1 Tax=Reyranella sp. CPCC 100927 TaxID=2599616 RepID=UPI0011B6048B|nr:hypothetical protein [Reyranella sp. CPCC 100927]TWT10548.1 hypothetical protein FQU96_15620 [Reyranella sp. CPCC 100927]